MRRGRRSKGEGVVSITSTAEKSSEMKETSSAVLVLALVTM